MVGVAGDHEAVAAHLAEIDWRSEHLERALDEPVGQVQVEEVGVQPGRESVVSLFQYRMSNAGGLWPMR